MCVIFRHKDPKSQRKYPIIIYFLLSLRLWVFVSKNRGLVFLGFSWLPTLAPLSLKLEREPNRFCRAHPNKLSTHVLAR